MSLSILEEAKKLLKPKYGWQEFFADNWSLLETVQEVINTHGGDFYPYSRDVFKIYRMLSPEQVRVVILGQDPYHSENPVGEPVAMGLAFSIRPGSKIPPSLKNIFTNISTKTGTKSQCEEDGDLRPWVEQGVFLLNTCLTVIPHQPLSHNRIWEGFIKRTIAYIHKATPEIPIIEEDEDSGEEDETRDQTDKDRYPIALLWGKSAQSYKDEFLGRVLMTSHPSPFSAKRGFLDSDHFNQVNQFIRGKKIVW